MASADRERPDGMESTCERTKELSIRDENNALHNQSLRTSVGEETIPKNQPKQQPGLSVDESLQVEGRMENPSTENVLPPGAQSGLVSPFQGEGGSGEIRLNPNTSSGGQESNSNQVDGSGRDEKDSGHVDKKPGQKLDVNMSKGPQEQGDGSLFSAVMEEGQVSPPRETLPHPCQESSNAELKPSLGSQEFQDQLQMLPKKDKGNLVKYTITHDVNFMEILCQRLDMARVAIKNWRNLAQCLGVPHDVSRKFDFYTHTSPTEDLFECLPTVRTELSVQELQHKLRAIYRNDLANKLEKFVGWQVFTLFSKCAQVRTHLVSELDMDSRTIGTWRSLAGQFNIPKSRVDQFGKCTHGPTENLFDHLAYSAKHSKLRIEDLKTHLEKMQRNDVLALLDKHNVSGSSFVQDVLWQGSDLLAEVGQKLDKDVRALKGWKNLAYRLEIDSDVYKQFDTSKEKKKPTGLLFEWLGSNKENLTIDELLEALEKIGRNDVVELVKKHQEAVLEKLKAVADGTDGKTTSEVCGILNEMVKETSGKKRTALNKSLMENARKKGYELRCDVPGDGNCMFHALSDQVARVGGGVIGAQEIREFLVQFLEDNPKLDGTDLVTSTAGYERWSDYLKDMRRDGTWGDHLILLAAANYFQRPIKIITSLPHNTDTVIKPASQTPDQHKVTNPMVLGHIAEYHFVSLQPLPGSSASSHVEFSQNVTRAHMGNGPSYALSSFDRPASLHVGAHRVNPQKSTRSYTGMSKEERLNLCPTQIPLGPIYNKLCRKMDTQRAFYDDFRLLAEKLGMDRDDIRWLEQQNSPTDKILNANKGRLTVRQLIGVLRQLEREDVASMLEDWVNS